MLYCRDYNLRTKNVPMSKQTDKPDTSSNIAQNKKAFHDYFIEQRYEAGLVLQGWEVKSLRAGRVQIAESYVLLKGGEVWIFGSTITPLLSASSHIVPEARRTRKLLLKADEISKLIGLVERKGYTLVPLLMYWKRGMAKLEIGVAKGKKQHDKRADIKQKDWDRQKQRLLKNH